MSAEIAKRRIGLFEAIVETGRVMESAAHPSDVEALQTMLWIEKASGWLIITKRGVSDAKLLGFL